MNNDKGVARVTEDVAGGLIMGVLAPSVFVNKKPITVVGAAVASHGDGEHSAPVMVGKSSTVFAEKQEVCRKGDAASCGHVATGSDDVFAGD